MEDNKVLEFKNLKFCICDNKGNNQHNISIENFSLNKGDFLILTGRNGSGKSSILTKLFWGEKEVEYVKTINGTVEFNNNGVKENILGRDYSGFKRRSIMLGQKNDERVTYYDSVKTFMKRPLISKLNQEYKNRQVKKEKKKEIMNCLNEFYLSETFKDIVKDYNSDTKEYLNKKFVKFSGGQKQAISNQIVFMMAKLFPKHIKVLLLDEPLNNLDAENKRIFCDELSNLRKTNKDLVVIMVTHCQVFKDINCELNIKEVSKNEAVAKFIKHANILNHYEECVGGRINLFTNYIKNNKKKL